MARLLDDALTQYLYVDQDLGITDYPWSFWAWFWPDAVVSYDTIMYLGNSASNGNLVALEITTDAAKTLNMEVRDASSLNVTTANAFALNTWSSAYAACVASNSWKVSLNNGTLATSGTSKSLAVADFSRCSLGYTARLTPRGPFSGRLAHVAVWNVELSDGERAALQGGCSPLSIRPANLAAYWPLWGVGSPEPDLRGAYPMTLSGSPTVADGPPVAAPFSRRLWVPYVVSAGGGEAIKKSVNEVMQLNEAIARALALRRFSADTIQLAESVKRAIALRRMQAETVNVVEASRAARGLRRAVADTLSIFEAHMAQKGLTRSVADVISIAEATGSGIATSIVKAINEALQLAESSLRTLALSRPVAETVQILESVIRPARWLRLVAETVTIAEATKAARALRRFASDLVQIIEATGQTLTQPGVVTAIVKNVAETMRLIEARSIAKWPTGRLGIDIRRGYAIIRAVGRLYAAVVQGRQYRARHEK